MLKKVEADVSVVGGSFIRGEPSRNFAQPNIEGEKELQVLGCGWRIVTCQFRGNKVLVGPYKTKAEAHKAMASMKECEG